MKQKISLVVFLLCYLCYSCNKDDDLNHANTSKVTSAEDIKVMSKTELDNYLSDDYIYSFNSNIARKKSDASRGGTLVKELKDFLAANSKITTQLQKKYGNIAWTYGNEHGETTPYAILPTVTDNETKTNYLLFITKEEDKLKLVARDRKDAFKSKSLKELNGKFEAEQLPRDMLLNIYLYFDYYMFNYVDCQIVKEMENLGNLKENRTGDRTECYVNVTTTTYDYYTQVSNSTYGVLNTSYDGYAIFNSYLKFCLNSFLPDSGNIGTYDPNPSYGGGPVTVPCCSCSNANQRFQVHYEANYISFPTTSNYWYLQIHSSNCKIGSYGAHIEYIVDPVDGVPTVTTCGFHENTKSNFNARKEEIYKTCNNGASEVCGYKISEQIRLNYSYICDVGITSLSLYTIDVNKTQDFTIN